MKTKHNHPDALITEKIPLLEKTSENMELDSYGNPLDGSELINCCFPDCGCACARVCMASNGANFASIVKRQSKSV